MHLKEEHFPYRQSSTSEHEYHSDEEDLESHASPTGNGIGDRGDGVKRGGKDKDKKDKPVATRRRVVQSCSECRRRKIKCDKK